MVQGSFKPSKASKPAHKKSTSSCVAKYSKNVKITRLGMPLQLPKTLFREEALDNRILSKAISVASEKKVAAKLLQAGGKITTNDIKAKGKELARELRRALVKKKVGRVEAKLNELKRIEEGESK